MKNRKINQFLALLGVVTMVSSASVSALDGAALKGAGETSKEISQVNEVNQENLKNVIRGLLPALDDVVIEQSYKGIGNPEAATDGEKTDRGSVLTEVSSDYDTQYNKGKSRYLQYDFGKPYEISQINVYKNLYGPNIKTIHRDVKIEISNDPEFKESTIIYEGDRVEEPEGGMKFSLETPVSAQYIRLHSKGNIWQNPNGANGWSCNNRYAEIEVLAAVGEDENKETTLKNVAFQKTKNQEDLTNPEAMTDGRYHEQVTIHPEKGTQAIQIDLGKVYPVEKVAFMMEADKSYSDLKIFASLTPEYSEIDTVASFDTYTQGENKEDITFEPKQARYITVYADPGAEGYVACGELAAYAQNKTVATYVPTNIVKGKTPGNKGKGILNVEAISDGIIDDNYTSLASSGNQYLQYDFKNRYPISEVKMVLEEGVTYNNLQVQLSNSPTGGFTTVYNAGTYTQDGKEPLVVSLDQPSTASHVRIAFTGNNSEDGLAKFAEVEIIANLDEEKEYDEMPDPYVPPTNTLYNTLVWSDEFNEEEVDTTKWEIIDGDPSLAAIYCKEAVTIQKDEGDPENGYLSLKSKYIGESLFEDHRDIIMEDYIYGRTDLTPEEKPWMSGRVESKNKFSFKNGRVAVRAKVNDSQGIWPAIWMLAQDEKGSDEIDILEYLGQNKYGYWTTNHYGAYRAPQNYSHGVEHIYYEELSQNFHVYEVEWRPDVIIFYFDGKEVFRTDRGKGDPLDAMHDRPMYMILETQVGGGWVGPVDPTGNNTRQDSDYLIDWVRVYQNDELDKVKFDDVESLEDVYSHTENLRIDTENPALYFFGGQPRIERSRAVVTEAGKDLKEHIVYYAPELTGFHATAYYATIDEMATAADNQRGDYGYKSIYNDDLKFKFFVSADGESDWVEVPSARKDSLNEIYPAYGRKVFDGRNIPEGMNFLKVEFPQAGKYYDQIHLAKVTMLHSGEEVLPETNLATTIEAPEGVKAGESFDVVVGIEGVTDPVFGADLVIDYAEDAFELNSIEPIGDKVLEAGTSEEQKPIRVLLGIEGGIVEQSQLLKLNFTAKETDADKKGSIQLGVNYGAITEGTSQVVNTTPVAKHIKVEAPTITNPNPEDINEDGKVDVSDLALFAYYYGARRGDSNWEQAKKADLTGDGMVDILDLARVADKILDK